jgi:hypothetical protein
MSDDLQRASGLWLKDGKRGKFMSGETSEAIPAGSKLLVFKNDRKEPGSDQPDYTLCFVTPESQPPMKRAEPSSAPAGRTSEPDDSDIPF